MIIKVNSPLWKRGDRGDFISFKSPLVPPFSKGEKKLVAGLMNTIKIKGSIYLVFLPDKDV